MRNTATTILVLVLVLSTSGIASGQRCFDSCDNYLDVIFDEVEEMDEGNFHSILIEILSLSDEQIRGEENVSGKDFKTAGGYGAYSGMFKYGENERDLRNEILRKKSEYRKNKTIDVSWSRWFKSRIATRESREAWESCIKTCQKSSGDPAIQIVGDPETEFNALITWIPTNGNAKATKIKGDPSYTNLEFTGSLNFSDAALVEPYTGLVQGCRRIDKMRAATIVLTLDGYTPISLTIPAYEEPKTCWNPEPGIPAVFGSNSSEVWVEKSPFCRIAEISWSAGVRYFDGVFSQATLYYHNGDPEKKVKLQSCRHRYN